MLPHDDSRSPSPDRPGVSSSQPSSSQPSSSQPSSSQPLLTLEAAWTALAEDARVGRLLQQTTRKGAREIDTAVQAGKRVHKQMKDIVQHKIDTRYIPPCSDAHVLSYERFTDGIPVKNYEACIHAVPELVNIVSLADAIPNAAGATLPFDLSLIAKRCRNASLFFSPRMFSAVQLAFYPPRSRVLLFRAPPQCHPHATLMPPQRRPNAAPTPRSCHPMPRVLARQTRDVSWALGQTTRPPRGSASFGPFGRSNQKPTSVLPFEDSR